ncbi:MAG: acyl-CoA desaturase [Steroidobacter sp.]
MMKEVARIDGRGANALQGAVVWSPAKSLWNSTMLAVALIAGPLNITISAVVLFVVSTYISLLLGHSVGMHRRFIHRSYECSKWLERTLVYIGVLVGVAGPFGILRIHDARDWAQRQPECHDFFAHRRSPFVDVFWQLNCAFRYSRPPRFTLEPEFARDPWYRFLERTWMLHQIPVGLALFYAGGWSWVVWGVAARVSASVVGHWSITYWCHNPGPGDWRVAGASVQASNIPGLGLLTYGECWHNNHHAFPESARMGLEAGQADPGWWVLKQFAKAGWVTSIGEPRPESERDDLEYTGAAGRAFAADAAAHTSS